jgi:hypothetical protein
VMANLIIGTGKFPSIFESKSIVGNAYIFYLVATF